MIRKRTNKYSAHRTVLDGIPFDSKREAKRWAELCLLEKAGGPLLTRTGRRMRLTVDFAYTDLESGLTVYEDAKGVPTRDYEVRRAVAAAQGIEVIEV